MTKKTRVLTIDEAKHIASEQGLSPAKIKTKGISNLGFIRAHNPKFDIIGWAEFERLVLRNKLMIQESGGYMTLVKASAGA